MWDFHKLVEVIPETHTNDGILRGNITQQKHDHFSSNKQSSKFNTFLPKYLRWQTMENVSIDLEGKIRVLHQLARTFGSRVCNKTFIKETNIGILHLHMDTMTG